MNLFYLDYDLDKCAEAHIDKHVTKMQLEAAQLLCTSLWVDHLFGFVPRMITSEENKVLQTTRKEQKELPMEDRTFPYLPTMQNHPSAVWVRSSLENFYWTMNYVFALGEEQWYRYGTIHKSNLMVRNLPEPEHMKDVGFTKFALAMTDDLKTIEDPVEAYRKYYWRDKAGIASWKFRNKPEWWIEQ